MENLKDWWKTTFGKIYFAAFDSLYPPKRTKREVRFIIDNLPLPKRAKILDVACGQGRHSIELARRKFKVTGVDYSLTLLEKARERAEKAGVSPTFIKGDMRNLDLDEKFDAAFILGNSFGYFNDDDNEKVIKSISSVLKPEGYLILDLPNTVGMLRKINGKRKQTIPDGYIITENSFLDPLNLVVKLKWTIIQNDKKKTLQGKLRLYTFPEMSILLQRYSLEVKKVFGSFEAKSYNLETPRMIIISQKQ